MPKSKKPRHRRRQEKSYGHPFHTNELAKRLESITVNYELIAEIKLPAGNATAHDLDCLRDIVNHALTDLILHGKPGDEYRKAKIECAGWALRQVKLRGVRLGAHFVATGDELNAIRDGVAEAGDILKAGYETRSNTMVNEFRAMEALSRERAAPTVLVTKKDIQRKMQRLVGQPWR